MTPPQLPPEEADLLARLAAGPVRCRDAETRMLAHCLASKGLASVVRRKSHYSDAEITGAGRELLAAAPETAEAGEVTETATTAFVPLLATAELELLLAVSGGPHRCVTLAAKALAGRLRAEGLVATRPSMLHPDAVVAEMTEAGRRFLAASP